MIKINEYSINSNITKELLLESGFTNYSKNRLYYIKRLFTKEVTLNITIPVTKNDILDIEKTDIVVLDENFLQPFTPFYIVSENPNYKATETTKKIVETYNIEMDTLVEKGIFKQLKKEEKKPKTKVRKWTFLFFY